MKPFLQFGLPCLILGLVGGSLLNSLSPEPNASSQFSDKTISQRQSKSTRTSAVSRVSSTSLFHRQLHTLQTIASLEDSELESSFLALLSQPRSVENTKQLQALIRRWIEVDAQAAMNAAETLEDKDLRHLILRDALATWVSLDPENAFLYAETSLEPADELALRESMFLTWAETDPASAMQHWHGLHEPAASYDILKKIALQWAQRDLEATTEHFQSTTSIFEKDILQYHLIGELGIRDQEVAIGWINENFHGANKSIALNTLTTALARVSPEKAIEVIANMPEGETKHTATENIARIWAKKDLQASLEWVQTLDKTPTTPELLRSIYMTHALNNHAEAKETFLSIQNSDLRNDIAGIIGERLAQADPSAALEWAASLEPELAAMASQAAVAAWANLDGNAALSYALNEVSDSSLQSAMLSQVAPIFGAQNPAKASQLLGALPDGAIKEDTAREIMVNWIDQDPKAATEWAKSISSDTVYREVATAAAGVHLETDPSYSLTWAQTLQDSTERYNLVDNLVSELSRMDSNHALNILVESSLEDSLKLEMVNKVLVVTGSDPIDSL